MSKSRIKIPKRVAGIKIPKALRKGPFMEFLNSGAGQLLLAEAAMAAVTLFAARQANGEDTTETLAHPIDALQRAGRKVKGGTKDARDALARNSARLQFALGEGVRAFRAALSEPQNVPEITEDSTQAEAGGKKKNSSLADPAPH